MTINASIRQLQAFVALAALRNFRQAASQLQMSQPALSQAIARLERNLGETLVDRTTRSVQLTPFAESILPRLSQTLAEMEEIFGAMSTLKSGQVGRVTLSCLSSIAVRLIPNVLLASGRQHPLLRITIYEDNSTGVCERVLTGQAEVGICSEISESEQLVFSPFFTDEIGVVLSRSHPLARHRQLFWSDLDDERMVLMSPETGLPRLLERVRSPCARTERAVCLASHWNTAYALVTRGVGISLLPTIAWPEPDHDELVAIPLRGPMVTREIGLVRKRGRTLSTAAQTLFGMLREEMLSMREVLGSRQVV